MAINWMRRTALAAACAATALLAACGSGSTVNALSPERLVSFGDAHSQVGTPSYTVNDGSINNWTLQVLDRYQKDGMAPKGLVSLAQGNARLTVKPDAAGNVQTLTVEEQITQFLAGDRFGNNDLILLSAGYSDLITDMALVLNGTLTDADFVARAAEYGRTLAAQTRRLVASGAKHVTITGPFNLGVTPWGVSTGRKDLLTEASSKFNQAMLIAANDLANNVYYVDATYLVNLFEWSPGSFSFANASVNVCGSVDPGPGIGIGPGQVNSSLCTPANVLDTNYNRYVFADGVYMTPAAHRELGDFSYNRMRERW